MQTIHFSILIHADTEKVWHTMLDKETYPLWAKEFYAGSYYEGSWNKGSEIHFVAAGKDGQLQGMVSRIKENIPCSFVSIEHFGMISNGVTDTTSETVKQWMPSFENYTFTQQAGTTELKIDMQVHEAYKSMFEELWPRALNTLKELCERKYA